MQFAEKESFHLVVLNNLRNSPWTELVTCANFSREIGLCSKSQRSFLIDIGIKPFVSENKKSMTAQSFEITACI